MGHGMCYFPTSYYQGFKGSFQHCSNFFPLWHLEYSRGSAEVQVAEGQRSNLMGVSQVQFPTFWSTAGFLASKFRDKPISCQYVPISLDKPLWVSSLLDSIALPNDHVGRLRWSLSIERSANRITPPPKIPSLPP